MSDFMKKWYFPKISSDYPFLISFLRAIVWYNSYLRISSLSKVVFLPPINSWDNYFDLGKIEKKVKKKILCIVYPNDFR